MTFKTTAFVNEVLFTKQVGGVRTEVTKGSINILISSPELWKLRGHNVEVEVKIIKDLGLDHSLDYMKKKRGVKRGTKKASKNTL